MGTVDDGAVAVVRRLFDDIFNSGNVETIPEIVAPDVVGHDAASPRPVRGVESVRQVALLFHAAFANLHVSMDEVIAAGGSVGVRWRLRGVHQGTFMGVEASGRDVDVGGMILYRVAEGKIVEYWGVFDTSGLMRQVGALEEA